MTLSLSSPAFEQNGTIPEKYTCDGDDALSPPLTIERVPKEAKSLVLLMDDPDIPSAIAKTHGITVFDHWTLFNIPPEVREIPEGTQVGTAGLNSIGTTKYVAPCPPKEYEPCEHRYIFTFYALSDTLSFENPPTKQQVREALAPVQIEQAELVGRYARK